MLIYHTDRGHNWGAVPGHGRPRLKLIDHGYCFKDWSGRDFQSVFAGDHAGEALPDGPLEDLRSFLDEPDQGRLIDLIDQDVFEELTGRGRTLVDDGVMRLP